MNVQKKDEPKLCLACKSFFGSEANNWMCSSCFKKSNAVKVVEPPKEVKATVVEEKPQVKEPEKPQQADKGRCYQCNKKVGLLGIECKCNYIFCNNHRMPEDHACTVDYKKIGQQQLSKQIEKVGPRKLSEI